MKSIVVVLVLGCSSVAVAQEPVAQEPCRFHTPAASLTAPHVNSPAAALSTDPTAAMWATAGVDSMFHDCTVMVDYPDLKTEVRAFWTDSALYFLFISPYRTLNLFLPVQGRGDRDKLWDRDVVEMFLGSNWQNINRYREFELAPTGDQIDLNIEYDNKKYDQTWNSGWTTAARIDSAAHKWYAAARIPLRAVSAEPVKAGSRWRMNLYRIDGDGPDVKRRFMCWQSTCAANRDPNHVPEAFGTLTFGP
jgi:hypothetical protein